MTHEIRKAVAADANVIMEMIRELAAFEKAEDQVVSTAADLSAQLSKRHPPFQCLVARNDDTVVGFALYFLSYSTWRGKQGIWLEDLYVREAFRGRGVGSALFDRLVDELQVLGGGRLEWPVLEWNLKAHDFYHKKGAEALTEWRTWRLELP